MRTPILQFGTSRFLQAHADLMISEALEKGQAVGPITVVQSSGHSGRAKRLAAMKAPEGFQVRIRGMAAGELIDRQTQVTSVRRAMSTAHDWDEVCQITKNEVTHILSNSGDTGFDPKPADNTSRFDQEMSFPAKLNLLLYHRFRGGGAPITIMPLELISRNGDVLKSRIMGLAGDREPSFRTWLKTNVVWVNSLVDRIVSEPLEPAGAVAEPYALWAVEAQQGLELPCHHDDICLMDDLSLVEAHKLHILNLSHTCLAARWLAQGGAPNMTVHDAISDPEVSNWLRHIVESEVLPGFGDAYEEAEIYWHTTFERFQNPFLNHKLLDIAQFHDAKVRRRIKRFLESFGASRNCTSLRQIASGMLT